MQKRKTKRKNFGSSKPRWLCDLRLRSHRFSFVHRTTTALCRDLHTAEGLGLWLRWDSTITSFQILDPPLEPALRICCCTSFNTRIPTYTHKTHRCPQRHLICPASRPLCHVRHTANCKTRELMYLPRQSG